MMKSPDDPDDRLECYREYLGLLARLQLGARLQGKVDLSGVVQQTLLEAHPAQQASQNPSDRFRAAWLRQLLANNLRDEIRKVTAQARDVQRERSLDAQMETSSSRIEAWLASEQSTPSQHAIREQTLLALAHALAGLPEDQRQAIEMHHLQGQPLARIAEAMQRTKGAVAALLYRGLKQLRTLMAESEA